MEGNIIIIIIRSPTFFHKLSEVKVDNSGWKMGAKRLDIKYFRHCFKRRQYYSAILSSLDWSEIGYGNGM